MGKEPVIYPPFKCPDCGVWWRGETHSCKKSQYKINAKTSVTNPYASGWIYCPKCGKNVTKYDWHTCNSKYGKGNPDDGHDTPKWIA